MTVPVSAVQETVRPVFFTVRARPDTEPGLVVTEDAVASSLLVVQALSL